MEISMPSLLKKIHTFSSFRFIEFFFFCFATFIFVNEWFMAYQLRFVPDIFDDSIRLVSGLYTLFGFVPYTDFAIVYPPGLLILIKILSLNYVSRFHVFAILYLVLAAPIAIGVAWKTRSWFKTGATVLLLAISSKIAGDLFLFVEITWLILLISTYTYIRKGNRDAKMIVPIAIFILCLLKWERVAIFAIFSAIGYTLAFFIMHQYSKRLLYTLGATVVSAIAAFIVFVVYLIANGSDIGNAMYFVFIVPLKILPYRKLPLPSLVPLEGSILGIEYVVYFCVIILACLALLVLRNIIEEKKLEYLVLLAFPIALIPYATGRADSMHSFPLLTTICMSLILFSFTEKRVVPLLVTMVVYFTVNLNLFAYRPFLFLQKSPNYIEVVDQSLRNCRQMTEDLGYKSIFVGRTDYSEYIYNHVMLYLINPMVKPATKYISDEPGLQNTCEDGEQIAQDLSRAQKPMVALLDTQPQATEDNLSSSMVSCEYIERWLMNKKHKIVGTCTHFGKEFEIRLYK